MGDGILQRRNPHVDPPQLGGVYPEGGPSSGHGLERRHTNNFGASLWPLLHTRPWSLPLLCVCTVRAGSGEVPLVEPGSTPATSSRSTTG